MTAALRFDPIRLPEKCEQLRKEVRAFLAEEIAAGYLVQPFGPGVPGYTYHLAMREEPAPGTATHAVADWLRRESGACKS